MTITRPLQPEPNFPFEEKKLSSLFSLIQAETAKPHIEGTLKLEERIALYLTLQTNTVGALAKPEDLKPYLNNNTLGDVISGVQNKILRAGSPLQLIALNKNTRMYRGFYLDQAGEETTETNPQTAVDIAEIQKLTQESIERLQCQIETHDIKNGSFRLLEEDKAPTTELAQIQDELQRLLLCTGQQELSAFSKNVLSKIQEYTMREEAVTAEKLFIDLNMGDTYKEFLKKLGILFDSRNNSSTSTLELKMPRQYTIGKQFGYRLGIKKRKTPELQPEITPIPEDQRQILISLIEAALERERSHNTTAITILKALLLATQEKNSTSISTHKSITSRVPSFMGISLAKYGFITAREGHNYQAVLPNDRSQYEQFLPKENKEISADLEERVLDSVRHIAKDKTSEETRRFLQLLIAAKKEGKIITTGKMAQAGISRVRIEKVIANVKMKNLKEPKLLGYTLYIDEKGEIQLEQTQEYERSETSTAFRPINTQIAKITKEFSFDRAVFDEELSALIQLHKLKKTSTEILKILAIHSERREGIPLHIIETELVAVIGEENIPEEFTNTLFVLSQTLQDINSKIQIRRFRGAFIYITTNPSITPSKRKTEEGSRPPTKAESLSFIRERASILFSKAS